MQFYRIKKLDSGFSYSPDPNGDIVLRKDLGDFNDENFRLKTENEELLQKIELMKAEVQDRENDLLVSRRSNADKIKTLQDSYEDKISSLKKESESIETLRRKTKDLELKSEEISKLKEIIPNILTEINNLKIQNKTEEAKKKRKEIAATLLASFKYIKTGEPTGDISSLIDDIFITSFSQNVSENITETYLIELEKKINDTQSRLLI